MNLYQMTSEFQSKLDELTVLYDGDAISINHESIESWFLAAREELDKKRLSVGAYIKNLEAEILSMRDVLSNLHDRIKRREDKVEFLKQSLLLSMQKTETKKVNGVEFDISLRSNPPKVSIHDEASLPEKYREIKIKETPVISLSKIKQDIESGIEVPGATIVKEERLVIK